jgi:hypothetical protein
MVEGLGAGMCEDSLVQNTSRIADSGRLLCGVKVRLAVLCCEVKRPHVTTRATVKTAAQAVPCSERTKPQITDTRAHRCVPSVRYAETWTSKRFQNPKLLSFVKLLDQVLQVSA